MGHENVCASQANLTRAESGQVTQEYMSRSMGEGEDKDVRLPCPLFQISCSFWEKSSI